MPIVKELFKGIKMLKGPKQTITRLSPRGKPQPAQIIGAQPQCGPPWPHWIYKSAMNNNWNAIAGTALILLRSTRTTNALTDPTK